MMVKHYLSNYVVTAAGVSKLSIVSVDGGILKSVKPFEQEIESTSFVPGVLVVSANMESMFVSDLETSIRTSEAETAKCVSFVHGLGKVGYGRVALYAIDVTHRTISVLSVE